MLHAPDFLGYESAIHMAQDHREVVERGLRLKKLGNDLLEFLGGRAIHPVNVRVGGFFRTPGRAEFERLVEPLKRGVEAARQTVEWVAGFDFPTLEQECESVALRHPDEYPFNEGRLVSSAGLDIGIDDYDRRFRELHVRHSNALHTHLDSGSPFLVGPMARFNLNFDRLTPACREAASAAGLQPDCRNPFRSIVVRAVELLYACEEALRIVRSCPRPERPAVEVRPRAGVGYGCTEAPRGSLYHRYEIDGEGRIVTAKIVAPTSQNQPMIESDLRRFVETHLDLPDDELTWRCEQVVRNYDPCISCATHFLTLELDRE